MTADPSVLDRIFDRLVRTLSAGSPDQLSTPFTVGEMTQALVPYRTYRSELGVDTLQDYEHALLELLAGERSLLVCDPDTVAVIKKELSSPDPDTGLLHRLQTVQVRMGAMRLPVRTTLAQPVARPSDDRITLSDAPEPMATSDAMAIGAAMDREDAAAMSTAAAHAAPATQSTAATEITTAPLAALPAVPLAVSPTVPSALPSAAQLLALTSADLPIIAPTPVKAIAAIAHPTTSVRVTPMSIPAVYGDPIDFRGLRHAPVDMGGVIFLFGMVARELGFHVEAMTSGFPRCEAKRQIAPGKWARLRIDFELESKHFRDAGRNPATCDLLVCWRDTWPDRPSTLDVMSLQHILPTLPTRD